MDSLQTVSELFMYISSISLRVNKPYQTFISLRQSILCGYDNVTFFVGGGGGGMPDMPHSLGCEATDWLRGIWSSFGSVVQTFKGVGASTVQ